MRTNGFSGSALFYRQNPRTSGSSLGIIIGVVFGVLAILVIVGFAVVYLRRRAEAEAQAAEQRESDEVETFYNDNQAETEKEFEVAFDNPVFDTNQTGIAMSDDFDDSFDEDVAV
jgi:flagellar biosynthesis/type III secretory pathway M-ring protein FliF/YscJ